MNLAQRRLRLGLQCETQAWTTATRRRKTEAHCLSASADSSRARSIRRGSRECWLKTLRLDAKLLGKSRIQRAVIRRSASPTTGAKNNSYPSVQAVNLRRPTQRPNRRTPSQKRRRQSRSRLQHRRYVGGGIEISPLRSKSRTRRRLLTDAEPCRGFRTRLDHEG